MPEISDQELPALIGQASNRERIRWQRRSVRVLDGLLERAQRDGLPAVGWRVAHVGTGLVADCFANDSAQQRADFEAWCAALGPTARPERTSESGVTHLRAVAKDYEGLEFVIVRRTCSTSPATGGRGLTMPDCSPCPHDSAHVVASIGGAHLGLDVVGGVPLGPAPQRAPRPAPPRALPARRPRRDPGDHLPGDLRRLRPPGRGRAHGRPQALDARTRPGLDVAVDTAGPRRRTASAPGGHRRARGVAMPGRIVPEPPQPNDDPERLAEERELARSARLAGLAVQRAADLGRLLGGQRPDGYTLDQLDHLASTLQGWGICTAFGTGDTELLAELTGRQWTAVQSIDDVQRCGASSTPTPRRRRAEPMAGSYGRRQVLYGQWEKITGDAERDALIRALRAIEQREGERRGWDRPARLWSLYLADIDASAVELQEVPPRRWMTGAGNPPMTWLGSPAPSGTGRRARWCASTSRSVPAPQPPPARARPTGDRHDDRPAGRLGAARSRRRPRRTADPRCAPGAAGPARARAGPVHRRPAPHHRAARRPAGAARPRRQIRAGLHTGEVELRDGDVGGIAVHLAARVMTAAGSGEILISRTVRDLVVGSNITVEDHGPHALKGIEGARQLFAIARA
jgi:hypothetical protein